MELFFETDDLNEINEIKVLLESNGIPIFIGNENTARNLQYLGPNAKLTLWLLLKEQLEDARLLMQDPDHEVKNQVNISEFYSSLESHSKESAKIFMDRFMLIAVLTAIGAFAYYAYIKINI